MRHTFHQQQPSSSTSIGPFILEHHDVVSIESVEALDLQLDEVDALARKNAEPVAVYLLTSDGWDGHVLGFGVGRDDYSFLTFDNTYVPGTLDDDTPTTWHHAGAESELPGGMCIPVQVAREAARDFVRTARRPTLPAGMRWVEDKLG